jgi:hypothetical protein
MSPDALTTLGPDTQAEELAAVHTIREHHLGWSLTQILDDEAITSRCSQTQIARPLDRPDVVRAVGEDLHELRLRIRGDDRPAVPQAAPDWPGATSRTLGRS